jgi:hypothetical protein
MALTVRLGWSLYDLDRTDIESLIPFAYYLIDHADGENAPPTQHTFVDQADWL